MASRSVHYRLLPTRTGHKIALMILNRASAMNAVDVEMVNRIDMLLKRWNEDDEVVAIVIRGDGEKAFCAGGDLRKLYQSVTSEGKDRYQYADQFFTGEYRKNYQIHQIIKPIIGWGNGFVMGGGLGLFISTNHRIGTESMKLAWPEIRIGLFPDVTATWYLTRLPFPWGHWMGLTGCPINAEESRQLELTHYSMPSSQWSDMIKAVSQIQWCDNLAENHRQVRICLQTLTDSEALPKVRFRSEIEGLKELFRDNDLTRIAQEAQQWYDRLDEPSWLKQGLGQFLQGCPGTAHVVMKQLQEGGAMSLKEAVKLELQLAYQAVRHADFAEGVRAMVIDKDYQPQWQHPGVADVPEQWVDQLTQDPWTAEQHPFADL